MKRAISACALVLVVATAGCGSGTGSGAAGPATLAPATTLVYASIDLSPEGAGVEALLGGDPRAKLGQAFTRAAQTSGKLDYARDVRPWLGETAAAVLTGVSSDGPDFAVLAASTDDDAAEAAIQKDLAGTGAGPRTYRGVDYKIMDDGTVNAVFEHFLVAGTEPALKAIIDTQKDGKSLANSEQWKTSIGERAEGKAGLAFLDVKGLLQSLASQLPGAQRLAAPLLLGLVQIHPFVATLEARADSLVVDVSSPGTKPDPRGPAAASSALIEDLPADAWLGIAVPKVGQALGQIVAALQANPLIGAHLKSITDRFRAHTGLDLQRDVLAAIGDLALFARGSTPKTAGGGLVVQSPKPAVLARTVGRLPALIRRSGHARVKVIGDGGSGFDLTAPHMPQPVQVRISDRGALAAYGAAATRAALHPSGRLGQTGLFRKGAAALGARPTLFVGFAQALRLAAASPHHRGDRHFQRALSRLQHLEYLAVGARRDGGLDVVRAVLGLR